MRYLDINEKWHITPYLVAELRNIHKRCMATLDTSSSYNFKHAYKFLTRRARALAVTKKDGEYYPTRTDGDLLNVFGKSTKGYIEVRLPEDQLILVRTRLLLGIMEQSGWIDGEVIDYLCHVDHVLLMYPKNWDYKLYYDRENNRYGYEFTVEHYKFK